MDTDEQLEHESKTHIKFTERENGWLEKLWLLISKLKQ